MKNYLLNEKLAENVDIHISLNKKQGRPGTKITGQVTIEKEQFEDSTFSEQSIKIIGYVEKRSSQYRLQDFSFPIKEMTSHQGIFDFEIPNMLHTMKLVCDATKATFLSKFSVIVLFKGLKSIENSDSSQGQTKKRFAICEEVEMQVNNLVEPKPLPLDKINKITSESEEGWICLKKKVVNTITAILPNPNFNGNESTILLKIKLKPKSLETLYKVRVASCFVISYKEQSREFLPVYWQTLTRSEYYKDASSLSKNKNDGILQEVNADGVIEFMAEVKAPDSLLNQITEDDLLNSGYCIAVIPFWDSTDIFLEKEVLFVPITLGASGVQPKTRNEGNLIEGQKKNNMMFSSYFPKKL